MQDELLVWIDIETTGLVPLIGRCLEVGMVITGRDCEARQQKTQLVGPPPSFEDIENWPAVVQEMHAKSGLLRDLKRGGPFPTISQVDTEFASWLEVNTPGESLILAGSSVHFDRGWLNLHMPKVASMLHYRMADVSALREFMRRWDSSHDLKHDAHVNPKKLHRVVPDLEDSLELARFYRDLVVAR